MGQVVRRGDFSTSVLLHLLSGKRRGWQMSSAGLPFSYVSLRCWRGLYALAVDTKGITTVARNSPIAFG